MIRNYFITAFRNIFKNKLYSTINILGLSLGLTSTILLLIFIFHEISYDRFHEDFRQLYRLTTHSVGPDYDDSTIATTAALKPAVDDLPEVEQSVRMLDILNPTLQLSEQIFPISEAFYAEAGFLDLFNYPLLYGDPQTALTEPHSILLTQTTYKRLFDDDFYEGRTLELNDETYTITGILKDFPKKSFIQPDALISLSSFNIKRFEQWKIKISYLSTFVKLKPEASAELIQQKIQAVHDQNYSSDRGITRTINLQPVKDIHLFSDLDGDSARNGDIRYVFAFSSIALFILLLACINFINLSTARSINRAREVGVRKAIGANRTQLITQFLGESVLVSLFALLIALILVELLLPKFSNLVGREFDTSFSSNFFLFLGISVMMIVVSIGSGMFPALKLSAYPTVEAVKGNLLNKPKKIKTRDLLVFFQFVVASGLILASLITYQQLNFIFKKDLGFQPDHIVILPIDEEPDRLNLLPLKNEILSHTEFSKVSLSNGTPFVVEPDAIKQMELKDGEKEFDGKYIGVDFDFFETFDLRLTEGRKFDPSLSTDVEQVLLLNQAAAEFMGWSHNPLGQTLALPRMGLQYYLNDKGEVVPFEPHPEPMEVIGVVEDFHYSSLYNSINPLVLFVTDGNFNVVSVRINSGNTKRSLNILGKIWEKHLPYYPFDPVFVTDKIEATYQTDKKQFVMLGVATILAVSIGLFGLIGLSSYTIETRTKEISIRKVLGATSGNILFLFGKAYSIPILIAIILATPVTIHFMNKWLMNFAYRIEIGWFIILVSTFIVSSVFAIVLLSQAIQLIRKNTEQALRSE